MQQLTSMLPRAVPAQSLQIEKPYQVNMLITQLYPLKGG